METLLVVAEPKNQYYNRVKPHGPARYGPSPSKDFRAINCRTFQSGTGILPTPSKNCSTPVSKRACSSSSKITTPSPNKTPILSVGSQTDSKTLGKSNPIAINVKSSKKEKPFNGSFSFSELWAGPAYSNSPPPSSLPIPKFSIRPKRTVSLELPSSASDMEMRPTHPIAKSAPASPTREHSSSARALFHNADSATRTLRRILNLDVDDE
ncbi:hypothetical protein Pyn_08903 [Prunus yedoensis var. nudiflora]|uniref:Uncharacterized protein n=1 Tax=Prunus yedoensis var. nudiflora TaxID=2094558 RepID=A0A314ZI68_PRUYE|nr:hypothetical protein Pyn_08903 [Prunus yedoensis var. nudiflora]